MLSKSQILGISENLVTRLSPRNNDSSNPFFLFFKKKYGMLSEHPVPLGRGIRIRTLNDGVRVRSVTVTLYLYICSILFFARTSGIIHTQKRFVKNFGKIFFLFLSCLLKITSGSLSTPPVHFKRLTLRVI